MADIMGLVLERQESFCLAVSLPKTTRNLRSAKQKDSSLRPLRLRGENFVFFHLTNTFVRDMYNPFVQFE